MAYALVQSPRENTVSIMDEETVAMFSRDGFAQLLERPWGCGMGRHIAVEHAACGVLHHDKHVEETQGGGDHHAEVTCDDRLGMIAHKGLPALGGRTFPSTMVHALGHVLPYRPRRDPQAQLQEEFIGNALLTPRGILTGHTTDERLQVRRERRASRDGLPAPE